MIQVEEMRDSEIEGLLARVNYGHLACARDDQPYVVPVHYAYEKPFVYIYTTEGMKTGIIRSNPRICLQVEEVIDNTNWRSVVIMGKAEQIITGLTEREEIVRFIRTINPTLIPAISIQWVDNWIKENVEAIFRITPLTVTGRSGSTIKARGAAASRKKIA